MRALSTPEVTTVSPNVDTLYGGAYLLLREQGPVVLRVPAIRDRYYSVALMDTSFDDFAIISPRTAGSDGGDWLIVPPGWSGTAPNGYRGVIEAPTGSVFLVQRIYVSDPSEIPTLHALQDAIRLLPCPDGLAVMRCSRRRCLPLRAPGRARHPRPAALLRVTNAYRADDPAPATEAGLRELFRSVGVGPGACCRMTRRYAQRSATAPPTHRPR